MKNLSFYKLLAALFLCWAGSLLTACHLNSANGLPEEESLELSLPVWPPQDSFSSSYPPLSRWKVQITGAEEQTSFYTSQTSIQFQAKKNRPFCVTARPITILSNGSESDYFLPAGYLYTQSGPYTLTWEQGYLALIMQKIFLEGLDECLSPLEIEYLISTFNWKKAQESIDNKLNEDSSLFYNPWLIPYSQIIEGIISQGFKASLLNLKQCTSIPVSELQKQKGAEAITFISPFIPENLALKEKKQFTLMKNSPIMIGDGNKYGFYITYKSAKKISLEFIIMPIYIEDI